MMQKARLFRENNHTNRDWFCKTADDQRCTQTDGWVAVYNRMESCL